MLAVLAPGQGAQRPGLLSPWLELDDLRARAERYGDSSATDIVTAGTTMAESDITATEIAQPLIVVTGLLAAGVLPTLPETTVLAGHSVGELTASALAGVLTVEQTLHLVRVRGAAMATAALEHPGGMVAVLGGAPAEVAAAVAAAGCSIANDNAPDQVVAAGPVEAVDRLLAAPPAGARLRRLAVAGAFHTAAMAGAREALAVAVSSMSPQPPRLGVLSNRDGCLVGDGGELVDRLVAQVCAPVRWSACVQLLRRLGVTATIELPPAGTLTALVRRALPGVETLALRTPEDLPTATRLVHEHGHDLGDNPLPWGLVVAPAKGVVRLPRPALDEPVIASDVLAHVSTRGEPLPVLAGHGGRVVEWLVQDGDPVAAGQPLARVSAESHS